MKRKHLILIFVQLILIGILILIKGLQLKDIIFIYLIILITAFIFSNIEYLFKLKQKYSAFMFSKLRVNFIITTIVLGIILCSISDKHISKSSAENDLKFMVQMLENIHPDIYQSISKDSFAREMDNEMDKLQDKITELEFYKICARLTSRFRTGHTNPSGNIFGIRLLFKRAFPFETTIINNKLFVTGNFTLFSSIPTGSEIIEINGKKISQAIDEWSNLVSYENLAYRNYQITDPLKIGIWNDFKNFKIKYIDYDSKEIREKIVNGGISSNIYRFLKPEFKKPDKLFFRELTPEVGYIGFFDCHDLKHFEQFYKSTFTELKNKGIDNLIIDIRNNGGGHTVIGAELMQYLFHQPFKEVDSAIVKVSEELIAIGKVKRKLGEGNYIVGKTYTRIPEPFQPRKNPLRFDGKTFLLINNGTFSAGQVFASSFKCYGNGTIIGEETGGVTVSFGDVHFFTLPNSGLKIMTSWEKAFSACGIDNQRGVMPDIEVKNSIKDFINHKDKVLEFTLNLIRNKK